MPLRRNRRAIRRVLAATDGSETAERAVAWAADFAARYDAELLLVRVVSDGAPEARSELERQARRLARARALVLVDEDPGAAIVRAAMEARVDALVVGNAGMSGRKEFLLGNVPNRISHNAPCTVVIVDTRT